MRMRSPSSDNSKTAWFWPTVGAALASKHPWLVIACDACDTVIDLDLTVKRRDPDAPIRVALSDVRCPRCNGYGRTRIVGVSRCPSICKPDRIKSASHCSIRHGALRDFSVAL